VRYTLTVLANRYSTVTGCLVLGVEGPVSRSNSVLVHSIHTKVPRTTCGLRPRNRTCWLDTRVAAGRDVLMDRPSPRAICLRFSSLIWHCGNMAKVRTTLSIDEGLIRQVRVRAARTGRRDSEVLEAALREGLGIIDRIRAKAALGEEAAHDLAHRAVHEGRLKPPYRKSPSRTSRP
jgi:plasmid stability protein